ncbi:MAG: SCO family protein, partial [Leeuwenhoekiella sp.]
MKLYRNELIGLLGALAMLVSCAKNPNQPESIATRTEVLPYYQEATYTPVWFGQNSDSLNDFHQIPAFKLVNQMGDTITEQTFDNKIYVANFFFTVCPGICPQMTSNMLLVQEAFKED